MTTLRLRNVTCKVNGFHLLDDVTFDADDGEFVAIVGPSGAGKTSMIRAIAGFEPVASGSILFDGEDVTDRPTQERDISIVTQDQSLFPTLSVRKNVAFPLLSRAFRRSEVTKRVAAESRALNIDHILDRWPAELSAGEQQLAQIARALVRVPRVFLMDEPLSNLDPPTKRKLRQELVKLQRGYGVTTLYVATRPVEIRTMAHRVVALDRGRVVQIGTPADVHDHPATRSVAELTGPIGWLRGEVVAQGDRLYISGPGFRQPVFGNRERVKVGQSMTMGIRPQHVQLSAEGPIALIVGDTAYDGPDVLRKLQSDAGTLLVHATNLRPGVHVKVGTHHYHAFDANDALVFSANG